jgi:autotransporter-associated beta strand protein
MFVALGGGAVFGATYTWDPAGSNTNFGGAGSWGTGNNWWNGTTTAGWTTGNSAVFSGTAGGLVALTASQTASTLTFSTTGYSILCPTGSALTLSGGSLTANQNASIVGVVAGTAGLTLTGPGNLIMGGSAANTFTGTVNVNSGTLTTAVGNIANSTLGSATTININNGGTIITGTASTYNSLIGNTGGTAHTIHVNTGGLLTDTFAQSNHLNSLILDGGTVSSTGGFENTFANWNFDGGVSTAGDGKTSYIIGGNAALTENTLGGTQFNIGTGDTLYMSTALSLFSTANITSRTLVKTGAGTLVLAGSTGYTAPTFVNAGTLLLANAAALKSSPLNITAGTVSFGGINSIAVVSLAGTNGGVLLLTNTDGSSANLTVANTASSVSSTFNGSLTGSGGSLTMAGPGTLTLGGTNNYTGTTTLGGGVLVLNNTAALAGGGPINFTGGTLRFSANNTLDYSPQFLNTNNQNIIADTNGQSVTFAANLVSSGGSVTKVGAGQLTLSGSNSYSGVTTINGGILQFASSSAVPNSGSGLGQVIVNPGGGLSAISGDANTVNGWLGTGDIATASGGAIALAPGFTDTSVDFTSGPGYPTLALGAVGSVTYNGTINPFSQPTGYYLGSSGTLWMTSALNDAGGPTPLTVVNGGTVVLTNSASGWSGSTTIQAGATLQLGDNGANIVTPVASISNSGTLLIRNALAQTFTAGISGPASSNLFAFGSSVLEIDGTNSVGVFSANGGTLNIGTSAPGTTIFNTSGKTVFGTNLGSAPRGPEVANWNATGAFTGGSFFGVADTGQIATFNMNGGSLGVSNVNVFIGNGGGAGGISNGTFNMNAGTVSVDNTSAFYIGSAGSTSTNWYGTGTLNVSGGSLYIAQGTGAFGLGSNLFVTMGWAANTSATINLTGGVLASARVFGGGSGTSTVNLNGGTLQCVNNTVGDWFDTGVTVVAGTNGAFLDIEVVNGTTKFSTAGTPITGPGSVTKLGPGLLVFQNNNSYTGGTVINNGILQAQTDLSLGPVPSGFVSNNITLNGGELRDNAQGTSLSLSANRGVFLGPSGGYIRAGWQNTTSVNGVISGGGPLTIANDGQGYGGNNVYLANPANTYSGVTTIGTPGIGNGWDFGNIATLNVSKLANGGSASSIGASTNNASNLVFNAGNNGTGYLNYTGTGDSTDRLFTVASGNPTINSSGTGPVNFTNPGAVAFTSIQASLLTFGGTYAGSAANTFAPAITDNGILPTTVAVKGSSWTLTGGSNNTFTGGVLLGGGTLNVTSDSQLQNNIVTVGGGALAFAGGVTSPVLGGLAGNTNIVLQDANSTAVTLYVGANNSNTSFAGKLSGPGGLFKTGAGMLTLSASQNYTGATTVNGGTLQVSPPVGISGFGTNGAGWTLKNTGNSAVGVNNNVATLTYNALGNTATALWYDTPLPLAGSTPWTASFTYNDSSGSGADGTCFVLQTAGTNALGAGGGGQGFAGISPSAGLSLRIFNSSDIGYVTNPASTANIDNLATTATSPVNLRLANNPTNITVTYDGSGNLQLTATQGANTFTSTIIASSFSTALPGTNGYAYIGFTGADGGSNATQLISNFNLTYSATPSGNVLPANTPLTVNVNGTFDLNGGSQAVGSLAGAGAVINSNAGAALLTLGNDGTNQTFSGTITGNLAVTKVGTGLQTFSGANSYIGGTTINAGALSFASLGALPTTGQITVNLGGGLVGLGAYPNVNQWLTASPQAINTSSSGAILLTPGSTDTDVNFATPGYNALSLGALGAVTYNGTIEPGSNGYYLGGGGGTLTVASAVNDANSLSTALNINGPGTVVLSAAPGYTGNTTVNTGGVLDLGGNTFTTTATVSLLGGTIQDGTVVSNSADYVIQSGLVSANLGGPVNLSKTTTGTATLTGANTYSGVTSINGGILNLGSTGAIPSGGTITFGGGKMQFSAANTLDYSGQILNSSAPISIDPNGQSVTFATPLAASNVGGLTLNGTGTLTLPVSELYSGTTTVNSGFLALTGTGNILPAAGNVVITGGTLDLGGNGQTISGTVSFQGGLTQSGTLTNNTVAFDGQSGTVTANLAGSAGLNKTTAGVLNLPGANSYSGSTTLTAGALILGNNSSLGSSTLALSGGSLEASTALSGVPNPVVVLGNTVLGGSNSFTLSGNLTNSTTNHTLTITNTNSVVTVSGNIYLSDSQGTAHNLSFNSNVANSALVLSGNIADSAGGPTSGTAAGTFIVQPNIAGDTVLISGTNTYTGTTSLGGNHLGVITITNSSAFGTSAVQLNSTQIATSTNLALNNNFSTAGANVNILSGSNSLTINGSFTNTANATFNNISSGLLTLNGNIFLTSTSGAVNSLTFGGAGTTILNGAIANFNGTSGTVDSLVFSGTGGVLYITGTNNSYTGATNISAGTVNVANLSNYGVNGSMGNRAQASEGAAGGPADPNGPIGIHIGSVSTGATLQYTGSTAQSTNRMIRLSQANNTIDASGSSGTATMSFTYSGTNVNLWDTGGVRTLTLAGSNTGNNTFAINLQDQASSATSLVKSGPGTWVVTNTANGLALAGSAGAFTGYSGGTTISGGTLVSGANLALGTSAGTVLLNPSTAATLQFNSAAPVIGPLTSSGAGAASVVLGGANTPTSLTITNAGTTTYAGSITDQAASGGTGSLTFNGAGTMNLTGQTRLGGTVTVGNVALNIPTGASLVVTAGGPVATGSNSNLMISNASANTATVNLNGGLLSVSGIYRGVGTNIGNGNLNLNGGTLQATASNGAFLQQLNAVNVNASTTIDTQANSIAIGQSMLGSGGLTKIGAGVLTLAAPQVYSGGTTLGAGTLAATGPENLGSGPVTLQGGVLSLAAQNVPLSISQGFTSRPIFTPSFNPTDTIDGTFFFYQAGIPGEPGNSVGVPIGGGLMSLANTNVTFQMQPYSANNDLSLGATIGTSGTLTLATPAKFTQLNLLDTDGNGAEAFTVTLTFTNGSTSVYSTTGSDWFNGTPYAAIGLGRAKTGAYDAGSSTNPRLYEQDINLTTADQALTVSAISFSVPNTGTTRLNVFAISGAEGAQSYANAVNVTNNATINVSQSLKASVGALTINSHTLGLASADSSTNSYSLTTGDVSLLGNPTFNVAPSAGGGAGTLILGPLNDNGTPATITETGSGTLVLTGTGTFTEGPNGYAGGEVVAGGTMIVTNPAAVADGSNLTVGNAGAFPAPVVPSSAVSPVPEPGTIALAAAGAMMLLGFGVRRRRKA